MSLFFFWILVFCIPLAMVFFIATLKPFKCNRELFHTIIVHVALLFSIAAMAQKIMPKLILLEHSSIFSFSILFGLALLFAFVTSGSWGILYGVSVAIQEISMFFSVVLLNTILNTFGLLILVMPIFVAMHMSHKRNISLRVFAYSIWGVFTIFLFILTTEPFVSILVHLIFGTMFFRQLDLSRNVAHVTPH